MEAWVTDSVICHSESFLVIIVHLCVYKESGPTLRCCMRSGQPRLGPWNKELGSRCRHPGHSPRCLETCFQQVTEAKSLCSEYIRWISYKFLLWEAVFFHCFVNPKLPKENRKVPHRSHKATEALHSRQEIWEFWWSGHVLTRHNSIMINKLDKSKDQAKLDGSTIYYIHCFLEKLHHPCESHLIWV